MLNSVVIHTTDEMERIKRATGRDKKYQNYYYTYPIRQIPDAFEKPMPEIFLESAQGSFTYNKEIG